MFATKTLRQAAAHAERTPLIRFIGKRTIPSSVDHSPHPHPASPTHSLPENFAKHHEQASSHSSFSSYRDHAQQFGPLRKTIKSPADAGIGGTPGSDLGPVKPPQGIYFDRNELPARFRRTTITEAEIEALESGGATLFA
ncbi:putative ribosomal protein ymr-31 protein [Phaeoacremonium minimum UCRPA7]|uniref:Putative ribosomal protein ymr-31 protein n=1 Tax=Phaeoacremonium minimum (strain UCR-PA7) TaxID=1286976 RepID=R8B8T3_PHAM7|nr:putative ribosomal protein ymr-31 protein [Phaeoacremonium minimum UCRPA7]EON95687.1 putative ribosomal protein ymr-31 protein [Phaeoacremonium minimum UCRPA7]